MLWSNRGSYGALPSCYRSLLLFYYYARFRGIFDLYKYSRYRSEPRFCNGFTSPWNAIEESNKSLTQTLCNRVVIQVISWHFFANGSLAPNGDFLRKNNLQKRRSKESISLVDLSRTKSSPHQQNSWRQRIPKQNRGQENWTNRESINK